MGYSEFDGHSKPAWNEGRKGGLKRALKQKEVWAIRFWLDQEGRHRDRALFDLAIDSKLRGCDLVRVRIDDLVRGMPSGIAPQSFSVRLGDRFSSRSSNRQDRHCSRGWNGGAVVSKSSSSPAGSTTPTISVPGSMPVLFTSGCRRSGSSHRTTAPIRCEGRRLR
jgi:hypothetical protein